MQTRSALVIYVVIALTAFPKLAFAFTFDVIQPGKEFVVGQKVFIKCSLTRKEFEDRINARFGFRYSDDKSSGTWPGGNASIGSKPNDCGAKIKLPPLDGEFTLVATDWRENILAEKKIVVTPGKTEEAISAVKPPEKIYAGQKLTYEVTHDSNRTYYCGRLLSGAPVYTSLAVLPVDFDIASLNSSVPDKFSSGNILSIDCNWINRTKIENEKRSKIELTMPNDPGEYAVYLIAPIRKHFDPLNVIESVRPSALDQTEVFPIPVKQVFASSDPEGEHRVNINKPLTSDNAYLWAEFAIPHPGFSEKLVAESEYREPVEVKLQPYAPTLHRTKQAYPSDQLLGIPRKRGSKKIINERDPGRQCRLEGTEVPDPIWVDQASDVGSLVSGKIPSIKVSKFATDEELLGESKNFSDLKDLLSLAKKSAEDLADFQDADHYESVPAADRRLVVATQEYNDARKRYRKLKAQGEGRRDPLAYRQARAQLPKARAKLRKAKWENNFVHLRMGAHVHRHQLLEIAKRKAYIEFYEKARPRHVKGLVVISNADVKYCAQWIEQSNVEIARRERINRALESVKEIETYLAFVVGARDSALATMSEVTAAMEKSLKDYEFYIEWVDTPIGIKNDITASLAKAYFSGGVGLIVEVLDKGSQALVYAKMGNTAYADFSRQFPEVTDELSHYRATARENAEQFESSELLRANNLIKLNIDQSASVQSQMSQSKDRIRLLEEELQAGQKKLSEIVGEGYGSRVGDYVGSRLSSYNPFSDPASWHRPSVKKAISWALQPPGGGQSNRIIQLGNSRPSPFSDPFERATTSTVVDSVKNGGKRWQAGWQKALTGYTSAETVRNIGVSIGRGIAIKESAELWKLLEKGTVEILFSSSKNEWDKFLRQEIEWYLIRRELLSLNSLLDVLESAFLHDLDKILNELTESESYERELNVIVTKPITDTNSVLVRADLNEPGWLARPLITTHQQSPAYKGKRPEGKGSAMRQLEWDMSDVDKKAARIIFPISDGVVTWNWTLDVTPTSPALRLDRYTFRWGQTTNKNLSDDSHAILFGTEVKLSLRGASDTVTIVH